MTSPLQKSPGTTRHDVADLESALDSLLSSSAATGNDAPESPSEAAPAPLDAIRNAVCDHLVPIANALAERYRSKGVDLSVDASSLLSGGRGILIDIAFGRRRLTLEGTAIDEGIAFTEHHYFDGLGPTVATGPMLSLRRLTDKSFSEFLYEQIIAIVKSESSQQRK